MSNNSPTFRLFRKIPNFMNGFSATFNFFGNDSKIYKIDKTEKEADWNSIYSDWLAVGQDLRKVLQEHGQSKQKINSKSKI
jgi:hypothetical protein